MEHSPLVARLLQEVVTARAAIATSYQRLWRPEPPVPAEAEAGREPEADPATSTRETPRPTEEAG
jgi:hypothetical protein